MRSAKALKVYQQLCQPLCRAEGATMHMAMHLAPDMRRFAMVWLRRRGAGAPPPRLTTQPLYPNAIMPARTNLCGTEACLRRVRSSNTWGRS